MLIATDLCSAAGVSVKARIDDGPWIETSAIYPVKGQKVQLKVARVSDATIRWYQIIPDISKNYKNANHPWEKDPYKWIGFAKIEYIETELEKLRDKWTVRPYFANDFFDSPFYSNDVGSFWIQAKIFKNGKMLSSPGIESSDYRGLSPKVFRISIRSQKGYLGYLTSFFNVPGLFGSIPYQGYNYIGADCADILMAAHARWKRKPLRKDHNVAMLVNKLDKIDEFEIMDGTPNKKILWNKKIKAGDFIAVRYHGSRQFQHIGALYKDGNENGRLDKEDIIIHAGPTPLQYSTLEEGAFDGLVAILRH